MNTRAPIPAPEVFGHARHDHLRVTDVDFQGHVNNTVFALFFASARYDFLGEHVRPHMAAGIRLVVASTTISYLAEMHYGQPVETMTRVLSMGRSSMQLEQLTLQSGRTCGHALTTMVARDDSGSRAWPEQLRALAAV